LRLGEGLKVQHSDSKVSHPAMAGAKDGRHSDAALRALAEAEERRHLARKGAATARNEINGRGGLDPARYGDWEVKGIASDF
jgi:hypothetical protein